MAGQRQATDLVVMKGRKHLTKAEIEARKNAEVVAPNDKVIIDCSGYIKMVQKARKIKA